MNNKLSGCNFCQLAFKSHQFKDIAIEALYQKYFLRMNQSNMSSLLALLIVIGIVFNALIYLSGSQTTSTHTIAVGTFGLIYVILEVLLLTKSLKNEAYLNIFSYVIYISFVVLEVLLIINCNHQELSSGLWSAMFFTYMCYTLLCFQINSAVVGGLILTLVQISTSVYFSPPKDPTMVKEVSRYMLGRG